MAEETKQNTDLNEVDIYADIRPKGFISFEMPFIYADEDETEKVYLNVGNIDEIQESSDELNENGIINYYLNFYQLDEEDPSNIDLSPWEVVSSSQNQVSPVDWPLFASCTRIGFNRYILTGGINLEKNYSETFINKFNVIAQVNAKTSEIQGYLNQLKKEWEPKSNEFLQLLNNSINFAKEQGDAFDYDSVEDNQAQKENLIKFFRNKITRLAKNKNIKISNLDTKFCKEHNVEYEFSDNLPDEAIIFNQDSPYQPTAIMIKFDFNPDQSKYEFTATYLPNMPSSRSNHTTVFHKGYLYVMGGVLKHKALNSVARYDILSQTWSDFPSFSRPRFNFTATVFQDHLYILGGHEACFKEDSANIEVLERIDLTLGENASWESLSYKKKLGTSINYSAQLSLVSTNDSLLLVGGIQQQNQPQDTTSITQIQIKEGAKWQIELTKISTNIRNNRGVVAKSFYQEQESLYIFGGQSKLLLEIISVENSGEQKLKKLVDNDYTEEVYRENKEFIISQPAIFID